MYIYIHNVMKQSRSSNFLTFLTRSIGRSTKKEVGIHICHYSLTVYIICTAHSVKEYQNGLY